MSNAGMLDLTPRLHGILFRPPESLVKEQRQLPVVESYADLRASIEKLLI